MQTPTLPTLHFQLRAKPATLEFRDDSMIALNYEGDGFRFPTSEQFHEYLDALYGPEVAQEVTELMAQHKAAYA